MFGRALLLAAVVCTCGTIAACSGGDGNDNPTRAACASGEARPIDPERVLRALRAHGFSTRSTGQCGGALDIVAQISNSGSGKTDAEGFVACAVRREPIYTAKYGHGLRTDFPKTKLMTARWLLENVECALYGQADPAAELRRLRAAMLAMQD